MEYECGVLLLTMSSVAAGVLGVRGWSAGR